MSPKREQSDYLHQRTTGPAELGSHRALQVVLEGGPAAERGIYVSTAADDPEIGFTDLAATTVAVYRYTGMIDRAPADAKREHRDWPIFAFDRWQPKR